MLSFALFATQALAYIPSNCNNFNYTINVGNVSYSSGEVSFTTYINNNSCDSLSYPTYNIFIDDDLKGTTTFGGGTISAGGSGSETKTWNFSPNVDKRYTLKLCLSNYNGGDCSEYGDFTVGTLSCTPTANSISVSGINTSAYSPGRIEYNVRVRNNSCETIDPAFELFLNNTQIDADGWSNLAPGASEIESFIVNTSGFSTGYHNLKACLDNGLGSDCETDPFFYYGSSPQSSCALDSINYGLFGPYFQGRDIPLNITANDCSNETVEVFAYRQNQDTGAVEFVEQLSNVSLSNQQATANWTFPETGGIENYRFAARLAGETEAVWTPWQSVASTTISCAIESIQWSYSSSIPTYGNETTLYVSTSGDCTNQTASFSIYRAGSYYTSLQPSSITNQTARGQWVFPSTSNDLERFVALVELSNGEALYSPWVSVFHPEFNNFPSLEQVPEQSGYVGIPVTFQLSASDPNGDALTFYTTSTAHCSNVTSSGYVTCYFSSPGNYTESMSVRDATGLSRSINIQFSISEESTDCTISSAWWTDSSGNEITESLPGLSVRGRAITNNACNGKYINFRAYKVVNGNLVYVANMGDDLIENNLAIEGWTLPNVTETTNLVFKISNNLSSNHGITDLVPFEETPQLIITSEVQVCEVTSAVWKDSSGTIITNATESDVVTLETTGTASCANQSGQFVIEEADLFGFNDFEHPIPFTFSIASQPIATQTWPARYQGDGFLDLAGDPEYFFDVKINNEALRRSSNLSVSELDQCIPSANTISIVPNTFEHTNGRLDFSIRIINNSCEPIQPGFTTNVDDVIRSTYGWSHYVDAGEAWETSLSQAVSLSPGAHFLTVCLASRLGGDCTPSHTFTFEGSSPVMTNSITSYSGEINEIFDFRVSASDADNQQLRFTENSSDCTFISSSLQYANMRCSFPSSGTHNVLFTVTDPEGHQDTEIFTFTVSEPVCEVISAQWSDNLVEDGTSVDMQATTTDACNGQVLRFELFENDGLTGPGFGTRIPAEPRGSRDATVVDNVAIFPWTARYEEDGVLGVYGDPEFFFTTSVNGVEGLESANELTVIQIPERCEVLTAEWIHDNFVVPGEEVQVSLTTTDACNGESLAIEIFDEDLIFPDNDFPSSLLIPIESNQGSKQWETPVQSPDSFERTRFYFKVFRFNETLAESSRMLVDYRFVQWCDINNIHWNVDAVNSGTEVTGSFTASLECIDHPYAIEIYKRRPGVGPQYTATLNGTLETGYSVISWTAPEVDAESSPATYYFKVRVEGEYLNNEFSNDLLVYAGQQCLSNNQCDDNNERTLDSCSADNFCTFSVVECFGDHECPIDGQVCNFPGSTLSSCRAPVETCITSDQCSDGDVSTLDTCKLDFGADAQGQPFATGTCVNVPHEGALFMGLTSERISGFFANEVIEIIVPDDFDKSNLETLLFTLDEKYGFHGVPEDWDATPDSWEGMYDEAYSSCLENAITNNYTLYCEWEDIWGNTYLDGPEDVRIYSVSEIYDHSCEETNAELRSRNLILIGNRETNPFISCFGPAVETENAGLVMASSLWTTGNSALLLKGDSENQLHFLINLFEAFIREEGDWFTAVSPEAPNDFEFQFIDAAALGVSILGADLPADLYYVFHDCSNSLQELGNPNFNWDVFRQGTGSCTFSGIATIIPFATNKILKGLTHSRQSLVRAADIGDEELAKFIARNADSVDDGLRKASQGNFREEYEFFLKDNRELYDAFKGSTKASQKRMGDAMEYFGRENHQGRRAMFNAFKSNTLTRAQKELLLDVAQSLPRIVDDASNPIKSISFASTSELEIYHMAEAFKNTPEVEAALRNAVPTLSAGKLDSDLANSLEVDVVFENSLPTPSNPSPTSASLNIPGSTTKFRLNLEADQIFPSFSRFDSAPSVYGSLPGTPIQKLTQFRKDLSLGIIYHESSHIVQMAAGKVRILDNPIWLRNGDRILLDEVEYKYLAYPFDELNDDYFLRKAIRDGSIDPEHAVRVERVWNSWRTSRYTDGGSIYERMLEQTISKSRNDPRHWVEVSRLKTEITALIDEALARNEVVSDDLIAHLAVFDNELDELVTAGTLDSTKRNAIDSFADKLLVASQSDDFATHIPAVISDTREFLAVMDESLGFLDGTSYVPFLALPLPVLAFSDALNGESGSEQGQSTLIELNELTYPAGFSLISLPLEGRLEDAQQLLRASTCDSPFVYVWDASGWSIASRSINTSFPISSTDSLFYYCADPSSIIFTGTEVQAQTLLLAEGFNFKGLWFPRNTSVSAELVLQLINNDDSTDAYCPMLYSFENGSYTVHLYGSSTNNFSVTPSTGFAAYCETGGIVSLTPDNYSAPASGYPQVSAAGLPAVQPPLMYFEPENLFAEEEVIIDGTLVEEPVPEEILEAPVLETEPVQRSRNKEKKSLEPVTRDTKKDRKAEKRNKRNR